MSGAGSEKKVENKSSEESDDEENEIVEESPCGRWLKRREEVQQRDVLGIECAYLAMDTEEGVEVVWNEVQVSERNYFMRDEEKIQQIFESLTMLEHPNIVKFHRYWIDTRDCKRRMIFITEYMSSGSLKQFLKRTKKNVKKISLQAWKRWCTQILLALSYLHSCCPPIIHGNLTCDTIFIQHDGLVKIGLVAPNAINRYFKACSMKNMHFIAPEYGVSVTPAIDVYSFGMCALEIATLDRRDSSTLRTEESINQVIESLDDAQQKDFIHKCLHKDPRLRPNAQELLFHPLLFEVHSLKVLSAHALVRSRDNISETITDEVSQRLFGPNVIVAEIIHPGRPGVQMKMSDVPVSEKLERFVEDVKHGFYPLTAFITRQPTPPQFRHISPEKTESQKFVSFELFNVETRRLVNGLCSVKPEEKSCELLMTILLQMDDKMNRQLKCLMSQSDTSIQLAQELVNFGFINEADREKIAILIEDTLQKHFSSQQMSPKVCNPQLLKSAPLFPPQLTQNLVSPATNYLPVPFGSQ